MVNLQRVEGMEGEAARDRVGARGTVARWVADSAAAFPDKPFIVSVDQDKTITHGEFAALAAGIGHALAARGVGANDRVALLANNSLEHLAAYIGTLAYGATMCTVHVEMNQVHFEEILTALAPKLVLYEEGLGVERLAGRVAGEWRPLGEWGRDRASGFFAELAGLPATPLPPVGGRGDVASIFYTSGTAAKPKGVVCTGAELFDNVIPTADAFGLGPDDRILDYRSFNWMSAQVLSALGPLARGATLVLARKFSASRFFDWVRDNDVTIAVGNPTIFNMLLGRPAGAARPDVPKLRFITSSSAPLLVEQWKRFEAEYGIPIAQGYGTSETGWIAGSNETTRRLGSVGRPLAYHRLAIVDADGRALPAGEVGAIELGGDAATEYRYLADDGRPLVNATGRVRTGDLGYLDADGYLYVTGRAKDLIIRGGANISPVEIDNVALKLPAVAEAAAVGVPDPIYGEEVVLYVSAQAGAALTEETILAHCRRFLPHAKMPKRIVFRDSLPKTERGKMDRKALAAEWQSAQAAKG
jgi:acyl-CoA synthetase (AMP-forming)/AMP-acid ligase II